MGKTGDIVKEIYESFARGDVAAVLAVFDPQIHWQEADNFLYADRNPYIGPQAVVEGVFQRIGADLDNFVIVPERFVEGADAVVVEGRYRATMKKTGASIDAQFAHAWGVRDGKIVRFQQYTDTKQWDQAARR